MGEANHDGLAVPGRIVLAHELPFTLGALQVDPSRRQVEALNRSETLEPRVMQVLVALARSEGRIVTRDELIKWCWDGRIVGEDSINRAIFRLRQVAAGIGGGSFGVETITKVGYRLAVASRPPRERAPVAAMPPLAKPFTRRAVALTGSGAVAAMIGGLVWRRRWRHRPNAEALEAFRRGDFAQRAGTADQTRQAVAYFERAVRLDPHWATAWGALALAYTHNLDGFGEAQLASLPPRIRSAADRALQLDSNNADAQLALACIPPAFRNWVAMEAELRRIHERFPHHWLVRGRLAFLLYETGRWLDGAELHKQTIAEEPLIAGPYAFAARALANAGRIQEADAILEAGRDRWPAHPLLFFARFENYLFTGRPGSAAAMLVDPEALPSGLHGEDKKMLATLARAVDTREPADIEAAVRNGLVSALADVRAIPDAAVVFALFGKLEPVFESLDRYLLNRGKFGGPARIDRYTRRHTDFLFSLPMAAARADPRFDALTKAIGLNDYWQRNGSKPR